MMIRRSARFTLAAVCLATPLGCDSGRPTLSKVHGKVTYQGKPVTNGNVLFLPKDAPKDAPPNPASGPIKPDGTYELTTFEPGDGAAVGEHRVAVIAIDGGSAAESMAYDGKAITPKGKSAGPKITMKSLVPAKYQTPDTSPLTKKVVAGDNTIDLELED